MDLLYIQDVKCTEMLRGRTRRLSSSFREVLSRQLSPKLLRKVRQPAEAKDVYGKICLSAGRYSGYEVYRNGISALPFRIETMPWGTWVGECFVIWKSLPGKGIFTPWDDMGDEDVECGLLIDRKNTPSESDGVFSCSQNQFFKLCIGAGMRPPRAINSAALSP